MTMGLCESHVLHERPPQQPDENRPTYLTSHDGLRLYYRLHGSDDASVWVWLLEGSGGAVRPPDDPMIAFLTRLGSMVAVFHPRGSGYSEGPRGDVEDFELVLGDHDQFLRSIRDRVRTRPLIVMALSAGGAVAAEILARNPQEVAGAILVNPAYRYKSTAGPTFGQILRYGFNWVFRRSALTVDMMAGIDRLTGEDLEEARAQAEAPSIVRYFSLRYLDGLRRCMRRLPANAALAHVPLLLVYGEEDSIIDHAGSHEIHRAWAHDDKTLVALPGRGHGQAASRAALPHVRDWLTARFPFAPHPGE